MNELKTLKDLDCECLDDGCQFVDVDDLKQEAIKTVNWYDGYKDKVDWRKVFMKSYDLTEEDLKDE